jgi:cob(I)alamin adenosyltransferase
MSIATKTGDHGKTGLMYNRRVSKCHPRVEAYGAVDELNAALGMVRAFASGELVRESMFATQKDLVVIMGELATATDDLQRYTHDGFPRLSAGMTARLNGIIKQLESTEISFKGWATPGENPASATLDVARTVCRRAERRVCALHSAGELQNDEVIVYLNRLSDLLWLLARLSEAPEP